MSMIEGITEQIRAGLAENEAAAVELQIARSIRKELKDRTNEAKRHLVGIQNFLDQAPLTQIMSSLGNISVSVHSSNTLFGQATEGADSLEAQLLVQEAGLQQGHITQAFEEAEILTAMADNIQDMLDGAITSTRALHGVMRQQYGLEAAHPFN